MQNCYTLRHAQLMQNCNNLRRACIHSHSLLITLSVKNKCSNCCRCPRLSRWRILLPLRFSRRSSGTGSRPCILLMMLSLSTCSSASQIFQRAKQSRARAHKFRAVAASIQLLYSRNVHVAHGELLHAFEVELPTACLAQSVTI